jgi:endonuclease/exonuclease/phosphatase family metal-dependent hydrolase
MKRTLAAIVLSLSTLTGCSEPTKIKEKPVERKIQEETLSIASFNIQVYGKTKREKQEVMNVLTDIVEDYDICAIQEVRDAKEETIPYFLNQLNDAESKFASVDSERLGRTNSKEQYTFIYNTKNVEYLGKSYTFSDDEDWFEREPFIAYFKSGNFDFVLINIHTKPEDATNEVEHLDDVVLDARKKFPDENDFIVLGDYNADGTYFDEEGESKLKKEEYTWIIPNSADTTVATSSNTYDRMVITTGCLEDYANKWDVRNFQTEFRLSLEKAKEVSDHYPIWALFYRNKDTD